VKILDLLAWGMNHIMRKEPKPGRQDGRTALKLRFGADLREYHKASTVL
jgi:hypothetical protein